MYSKMLKTTSFINLNKSIISVGLVLHILLTNLVIITTTECPNPQLLNPCKCENDVIICGGNDIYDLKMVFDSMSLHLSDEKKHFKKLFINNTAITELKRNTFYDLTFDEIQIERASKLTLID